MKVCIVHNAYGVFSGEEAAVEDQVRILKSRGHEVVRFSRSSAELGCGLFGNFKGFLCGVYNPVSRLRFSRLLADQRPDLVHVHNVFPLISPSILPACRRAGVPVAMTMHNFRLVCPNALLLRGGELCRLCLGGHELECVKLNCEGCRGRSVGYALRTAWARRRRYFLDNVGVFLCLTAFHRGLFIGEGFPDGRCVVVPNSLPSMPRDGQGETAKPACTGVLYVGRVSPERDVPLLVEAARRLPEVKFTIAGDYTRMPDITDTAPPNTRFLGPVPREHLASLYADARFVVFATRCHEGLPVVLLEAMSHGKATVCTRAGGLPEVITDGLHGLLYERGNVESLAAQIRRLWSDPDLCAAMGGAARERAASEYGEESYYCRLMNAYRLAGLRGADSARAGNAGNAP
jgi:glycosyltransferase involved in cell wall biosynthesis